MSAPSRCWHGTFYVAVLAVKLLLLLPLDQSVAGILPDQGDKGRLLAHGGLQFLTVHHKTAVAAHRPGTGQNDRALYLTDDPSGGSNMGGRGWIARAALLKTAHWAVFAPSSATSPQLFESTLATHFARQIKQKLRYPLDTGVLGGRGWITRAAHLKKPRRGFFPRRTIRRVDAVRIHPLYEFSLVTKQKPQRTCIR